AVNISESYGSRTREAHAPILLEIANIPCTGSDALTLSATLDKHLTKLVARQIGLNTPDWTVVKSLDDVEERGLPPFPVFAKPRYEGTAKGISPLSKCHNTEELVMEVSRVLSTYTQDVLIEQFIEGAEFTVGVIGHDPPEALPVLQRATELHSGIGLHAIERHENAEAPFEYNAGMALEPELEFRLQRDALRMHDEMGCLDFSRSDFRVDPDGNAWFLEINPLPTFEPGDTFAILAELAGVPYDSFLSDVLCRALNRLGFD
ncbi:MAG: D-alanine--D-alanine ligase, partial [Rubricoccaceae bacterium]|nr:D-alanine--D-alanine ligase [Rubricoccaceae bacterium]